MIEVREATIDDADAIATVHIDSWRVGYRGIVPDEYLDSEEFATSRRDRWRDWTWHASAASRLFVVSVHGRLVGFGHAGPERTRPRRRPHRPARSRRGLRLLPPSLGVGQRQRRGADEPLRGVPPRRGLRLGRAVGAARQPHGHGRSTRRPDGRSTARNPTSRRSIHRSTRLPEVQYEVRL